MRWANSATIEGAAISDLTNGAGRPTNAVSSLTVIVTRAPRDPADFSVSVLSGKIPDMVSDWHEVLRDVASRLNGAGIDWMLLGSAATALHGAAIAPGDIDVALPSACAVLDAAKTLPTPEGASASDDPTSWRSSARRPLLEFTDPGGNDWTFGRWLIAGIDVEFAHINQPDSDALFGETFGEFVWSARITMAVLGESIPVVPVEAQIATMIARGQDQRLAALLPTLNREKVASSLLRRAIEDRKTQGIKMVIPDLVLPYLR